MHKGSKVSDLDKAKDDINNTRLYMGFVFTAVIALIAGLASMYNSDKVNALFWIGSVAAIMLSIAFALFAKKLHEKTEKLKDL